MASAPGGATFHIVNETGGASDVRRTATSAATHHAATHIMPMYREEMETRPYDGGEPIKEYLIQFEIIALHNGWTDVDRAWALLCALDGPARGILAEFEDPAAATYSDIKKSLERRFGPTDQVDVHEQALSQLRMTSDQRIREVEQEVQRLVRLAYPYVDGATLQRFAVKHLIQVIGAQDIIFYIKDKNPLSTDTVCELYDRYRALTGDNDNTSPACGKRPSDDDRNHASDHGSSDDVGQQPSKLQRQTPAVHQLLETTVREIQQLADVINRLLVTGFNANTGVGRDVRITKIQCGQNSHSKSARKRRAAANGRNVCTFCDRGFPRPRALRRHEEREHQRTGRCPPKANASGPQVVAMNRVTNDTAVPVTSPADNPIDFRNGHDSSPVAASAAGSVIERRDGTLLAPSPGADVAHLPSSMPFECPIRVDRRKAVNREIAAARSSDQLNSRYRPPAVATYQNGVPSSSPSNSATRQLSPQAARHRFRPERRPRACRTTDLVACLQRWSTNVTSENCTRSRPAVNFPASAVSRRLHRRTLPPDRHPRTTSPAIPQADFCRRRGDRDRLPSTSPNFTNRP